MPLPQAPKFADILTKTLSTWPNVLKVRELYNVRHDVLDEDIIVRSATAAQNSIDHFQLQRYASHSNHVEIRQQKLSNICLRPEGAVSEDFANFLSTPNSINGPDKPPNTYQVAILAF